MYLSEIHRQISRNIEENTSYIPDENIEQMREKGNDDDVNSSRLTKKNVYSSVIFTD